MSHSDAPRSRPSHSPSSHHRAPINFVAASNQYSTVSQSPPTQPPLTDGSHNDAPSQLPPSQQQHDARSPPLQPSSYLPNPLTTAFVIYVGKLPPQMGNGYCTDLFKLSGGILNFRRMHDPQSGANKTFGFVDVDGAVHALRFCRLLQQFTIHGQPILVNMDTRNKLLLQRYVESRPKPVEVETDNDATADGQEAGEIVTEPANSDNKPPVKANPLRIDHNELRYRITQDELDDDQHILERMREMQQQWEHLHPPQAAPPMQRLAAAAPSLSTRNDNHTHHDVRDVRDRSAPRSYPSDRYAARSDDRRNYASQHHDVRQQRADRYNEPPRGQLQQQRPSRSRSPLRPQADARQRDHQRPISQHDERQRSTPDRSRSTYTDVRAGAPPSAPPYQSPPPQQFQVKPVSVSFNPATVSKPIAAAANTTPLRRSSVFGAVVDDDAEANSRLSDIPSMSHSIPATLPSDPQQLLQVPIDWYTFDKCNLLSLTAKPWITAYVRNYFGGVDEPDIVDSILQLVSKHSTPQSMKLELEGAFGPDANKLVESLWRIMLTAVKAQYG